MHKSICIIKKKNKGNDANKNSFIYLFNWFDWLQLKTNRIKF